MDGESSHPVMTYRRLVGWFVGAGAQVAFAVTVVALYRFLAGHPRPSRGPWLWRDVVLALQFAAPHSVLRLPRVQKLIAQRIGREFFGAFYCWATCFSLALVFAFWRTSATTVWSTSGVGAALVTCAFLASWVALAYSLHLTGIGYQTGLTEWNSWRRREPVPRRKFVPRGAYAWIRHPVYLSFLGLIWFHPRMTADQLVLAILWTVYIAIGSYLKDERLAFFMGQEYRSYQERVPGYPGLYWGPLGVRSAKAVELAGRPTAPAPVRVATTR